VLQVYTCITANNTVGFVVRIDESLPSWVDGYVGPRRFRWNRFAFSRTAMLEKINASWDQLVDRLGRRTASELKEKVDSISDTVLTCQRLEYTIVNGALCACWVHS
jgi:hypothetical protein